MFAYLFELKDLYLAALPRDLIRYVAGAGGVYLVINLALSSVLARRKIRLTSPLRCQMTFEILASLRTVLIFALGGAMTGLLAQAGLATILQPTGWSGLAISLGLFAVLALLHDAYFYWVHYAMHRVKRLRRIHEWHHLSFNPSPFTSYSFNISEAAVHMVFLPLAALIVPLTPLAGFLFVTHMMLRNALGHCGYEVFPATRAGKPLFDWMTTTTHHDLHHAKPGHNFGLYFTWWDRWMGTENPNYLERFAAAVADEQLKPQQGLLAKTS